MRDLRRTSFTELNTLAQCEQKWWFRYGEDRPYEPSAQMRLGTVIHEVVGEWWWEPTLAMREIAAAYIATHDVEPETWETALWLLDRYEQHHGRARAEAALKIVGREVKFTQKLPQSGVEVVAYIDELALDDNGGLWIVERKTMYDWRRLSYLQVDPQLVLYAWAVRSTGLPVEGVIFDAIRTFRWKIEKPTQKDLKVKIAAAHPDWTAKAVAEEAKRQQDEHPGADRPVAESFETHLLDFSESQIADALADAESAIQRRALLATGVRPVKNIGLDCARCAHQADCWDLISFGAGSRELEMADA